MNINGNFIEPGQNQVVKLSVGRLPSDTKIFLQVHAFRSLEPGPTVLFMAGVHGDEINSMEIVRRALAGRLFEGLKRGSVLAIPLLNVYGFNNFSRDVPDGKDVNRSFPGSPNGSMASRVAHVFTKNILPVVDFGVDFHTGGNFNYNFPQLRFSDSDPKGKSIAAAFAAPFSVVSRPIPKSLRKTAFDAGKSIVVYEGGENLRLDPFSVEEGIAGIKRLLHHHGMLAEWPPQAAKPPIQIKHTRWLRAERAGMFRWLKRSGEKIVAGDRLGVVNDPFGQDEIPVVAKKAGYIIGHNNNPVVGMGDALFHIGLER